MNARDVESLHQVLLAIAFIAAIILVYWLLAAGLPAIGRRLDQRWYERWIKRQDRPRR